MNKISLTLALLTLLIHPACLRSDSASNGTREITDKTTSMFIAFLDDLLNKNIIDLKHLERILGKDKLINPIDPAEAASSHTAFMYSKQFEEVISHKQFTDHCDITKVKSWVAQKIEELKHQTQIQQEAHEDVKDIEVSLDFVTIPDGHYVSKLDQKSFDIEAGIELQKTPVTQAQWFEVMGYNPAFFSDGIQSKSVVFTENPPIRFKTRWRIIPSSRTGPRGVTGPMGVRARPLALPGSICTDFPVENVSYAEIQKFIEKLNKKDTAYTYALPSVRELEAFLYASSGKSYDSLPSEAPATNDQTHAVTSGAFWFLGNRRIWDLLGNVWQFTRDQVGLAPSDWYAEVNAQLLFGGSYETSRVPGHYKGLFRPIVFEDSKGKTVGFRLVRYPKKSTLNIAPTRYTSSVLSWDENDVLQDSQWAWPAARARQFIVFCDDASEF